MRDEREKRLDEMERRLTAMERRLAGREGPGPLETFFAGVITTFVSVTLVIIALVIGVALILLFLFWCCPEALERWLPG